MEYPHVHKQVGHGWDPLASSCSEERKTQDSGGIHLIGKLEPLLLPWVDK